MIPMKAKILVIEDDPAVVIVVVDQLEFMGYDVRVARNGLDGLEQAKANKPDLVILDVMMPEMDGYEVCRHLRSLPSTKQIPILMLTAKGQLDDKLRGFKTGVNDYLPKPYDKAEFEARVKALLKFTPPTLIIKKHRYSSLFISYGGPDEKYVTLINHYLMTKGIQTWFFPSDATPGEKLQRVMHNGVNEHDRVLLICSENSLCRLGVLNEIEHVLAREAREGGKTILLPITLDDYVYSKWVPERTDIADQIRSRVITKFPKSSERTKRFRQAADKLIRVLEK